MKIELKHIKIKDLIVGFEFDEELGVKAYNKILDVRPEYQRSFVYKDKQRDSVIETLTKNFPLNVLYWVDHENGKFEVLDGQQRIISICQYCNGYFSYKSNYFHSLSDDEKERILNYELMVYFCVGTDKEKLDWFETINIAGEPLSSQELKNAMYTGPWLSDAKRYFSRPNIAADTLAKQYTNVDCNRQELLELALNWICLSKKMNIREYMSKHQKKENASELWNYFRDVINWIEKVFIINHKEMKSINWGVLYLKYKDNSYDSENLKNKLLNLRKDNDVQNKKGIYEYLLSGDEKTLNLRSFDDSIKIEKYEMQDGKCAICNKVFLIDETEADHIDPWSQGGKTIIDNCQILCKSCNRRKSNK